MMMPKVYTNYQRSLSGEWPRPNAAETVNDGSWMELLPEPMSDLMDKMLERMLNISMLYFSMLGGIVVLTIGLGILIIGFANFISGLVLAAGGALLIAVPALFLKFSKN